MHILISNFTTKKAEKILKERYGLPVANADNVFKVLKSLGIVKWEKIENSVMLKDYLKGDLTEEEKRDLAYLPRLKITNFRTANGEIFKGFRWALASGVRVFALVDEFVPVCGEFQHGCEEVLLDLPGGKLESDESPETCAWREFEEESGIVLKEIVRLGSIGMPVIARRYTSRIFSFRGVVANPLLIKEQNLDQNEHLKTVLVSLEDWLKLIEREVVQCHSASTTLLALRKMGKI